MTEQEKQFFEQLTESRTHGADLLDQRFLRGMWNSIVEKYSDQAHFIYELLQNADDAGADSVRFILEDNQLIFAHNGRRWFSVSNPTTEDIDTERGSMGDINAITSVANSNKSEASIGKFGVGFKAVFQYTASPRIYGPNIRFRIDRYIVPTLLDKDCPVRRHDETLFIFPFDRHEKSAKEAYTDISDKLQSLTYPLLFLGNLKSITFSIGSQAGSYEKKCDKDRTFDQTIAQHLILTQSLGNDHQEKTLWLFTREDQSGRSYSCGFFSDDKGNLRPVDIPAFCFFPTKEVTGLNFIIHAPFLLTDSREGIRAGVKHNTTMIDLLSMLAADSLVYLRDIGIEEGKRLIDDGIISIIPYDEVRFLDAHIRSKVPFAPFFINIRRKLISSEIIPTRDGYVLRNNAYWAAVPQLASLFTNEQLAEITGNPNASWAFVSLGRDGVQRNNSTICEYIDTITQSHLNEFTILDGRTEGRSLYTRYVQSKGVDGTTSDIHGIPSDFVERQSIEWLHRFYKWMSETKQRQEGAKSRVIYLNQDKKAVAAVDKKGQPILFMPDKDMEGCETVYAPLLENVTTVKFFDAVGIRKPCLRDYIYNVILPQYSNDKGISTIPHFKLFFKYYCECPQEEQDNLIDIIRDKAFVLFHYQGEETRYRGIGQNLYFPTMLLLSYFEVEQKAQFIMLDTYTSSIEDKYAKMLQSFLIELGVSDVPRVYESEIDRDESRIRKLPQPYSTGELTWHEKRIDGCQKALSSIVDTHDISKSIALWNVLLRVIEVNCRYMDDLAQVLRGQCNYFYRTKKTEYFESVDVELLRSSAWLLILTTNKYRLRKLLARLFL